MSTARALGKHSLTVYCRPCHRYEQVDLVVLIACGLGDRPLDELRWTCATCSRRDVGFLVGGNGVVDQEPPGSGTV